jgi:hypothetical protein
VNTTYQARQCPRDWSTSYARKTAPITIFAIKPFRVAESLEKLKLAQISAIMIMNDAVPSNEKVLLIADRGSTMLSRLFISKIHESMIKSFCIHTIAKHYSVPHAPINKKRKGSS